jgi:fumarate reductase flavoprotein subunit
VRELAAWGVPWSRIQQGDREVIINSQKVTITERAEAQGLVAQRDFGGTKKWRTCYVSDGTGHAMLQTVSDQAIGASIPVHERTEAIALIHDGSRCYGAIVRNLITGELVAYVAKATAIATGGAGRIYRVTTNAVICEGIGTAIALETGVATLGNMEAVQFHPTGIFPAGILVTEGCRGDGGLRASTATASCLITSPRRRSSLRATWSPGAWRSTSRRATGRSRATASTSGSTSRCWARSTSTRTCGKSGTSATTSSASTR